MPTWNQFAWSVLLFWAMSDRNQNYQELISDDLLLNTLRNNPAELNIEQIQANVIRRFLNAWRCRMVKSLQAAEAIQNQLILTHPYRQALGDFDLETVDFDANIVVGENQIPISQACEEYYDALRNNIGHRFAATASSKLLHLLQPNLFVMWDKYILADYRRNTPQIRDSGSGYCTFLMSMQEMAINIREEFNQQNQGQGNDPATFLSQQLHYDQPQTFAKFVDEYNWVTITKGVPVPPPWHPC